MKARYRASMERPYASYEQNSIAPFEDVNVSLIPSEGEDGFGSLSKALLKDLMPGTPSSSIPFLNILLTGQIGAGKSSYFNSLNSIFNERVTSTRADSGVMGTSLTKEFHMFKIYKSNSQVSLPLRIFDTMGLETNPDEVDVRNILQTVDGHVPDRYEFSEGVDFHQDTPEYISCNDIKRKAHCVAMVIDGETASHLNQQMWNKFNSMKKGLEARGIPLFVLLTKMDRSCSSENIAAVYQNTLRLRRRVSSNLENFPVDHILPVMNYHSHVELNEKIDVLLLYSAHQMSDAARQYVLQWLISHPNTEKETETETESFSWRQACRTRKLEVIIILVLLVIIVALVVVMSIFTRP